ncbi:hypothetical protein [Actinomadura luteofluorescens]|uniref:hypothetical protein n=1 Tax=Actinomadura luteofluorescens TaxID=46163 RepID=UPI003D94F969
MADASPSQRCIHNIEAERHESYRVRPLPHDLGRNRKIDDPAEHAEPYSALTGLVVVISLICVAPVLSWGRASEVIVPGRDRPAGRTPGHRS